jgi:hypothetical protein
VLRQLCRLLNSKNPHLFGTKDRVQNGVAILIEVPPLHFLPSQLLRS